MSRAILRFFVLKIFVCIVAKDPPAVTIPGQGTIIGREVSRSRVQKIIGYYAIPYAKPPLGILRFAPPNVDPLPAWDGIRNVTEYAPACLQNKENLKNEALTFIQLISEGSSLEMSEDCLYLNVFVPGGTSPENGFATIIWIHPGNFTTGSSSIWKPHTLVYRHRIIVVTFGWRLGIMGFFTTMDGEAPGNYGLLDQQAAMLWVKRNIQLFGGNPDNISLMGYGSGGISIGLHMINERSRELFHKALIMSGNFLSTSAIKYPQEDKTMLDKLAENFACIRTPTAQLINCLRGVDDGGLLVRETMHVNWRPLIDVGLSNTSLPFLSESPKNSFEKGDYHKVPLLTGYTNMETVLDVLDADIMPANVSIEFLQQIIIEILNTEIPQSNFTDICVFNYDHIFDAVWFFYGPTTDLLNIEEFRKIVVDFTTDRNYASSTFQQASYLSKEQKTFVYRFDIKPITRQAVENLPEWISVPHLFDLLYIWGVPYWTEFDGSWELRDKRISDIIMTFWTNFAKTSDPTEDISYPIKWEAFTKEKPGILVIDGTFNMSNNKKLNYKAFEFWNDFYPKVYRIATQCCNATDSAPSIEYKPHLIWTHLVLLICLCLVHM